MEIEIPEWLTTGFITRALEDGEEDTITVDNIEVDKPIAKGDNYVCEIFRVKVDYRRLDEHLKTSLIVKAPMKGPMYEYMIKMGILDKEPRIYKEYLPKIDDIIGNRNSLTARSYHCDVENVIVLEDLKHVGFVMADRQKQLDFDHCVIALKTLATYHAASVKLHDQEPDFVEDIGKEIFFIDDLKDTNEEFAKLNFKIMAEESKSVPELTEFVDTFLKFSEIAWKVLTQVMGPRKDSLNVLNHGDFWVNNMLFKYEDHKPTELKLIDLQVGRYASPVTDLLYFLYGSVQEDLRVQRTDELLRIYLKELNAQLEKFGTTQRLSESEFISMYNASEFFGLFVTIQLFPIIIADPKTCVVEMKEVTIDDFKEISKNPFSNFYRSKKFTDILAKRLAEFKKKGMFDNL